MRAATVEGNYAIVSMQLAPQPATSETATHSAILKTDSGSVAARLVRAEQIQQSPGCQLHEAEGQETLPEESHRVQTQAAK